MYGNKKVACVIPAFNEEKLIRKTLLSTPASFDFVIVVNDKSTDKTAAATEESRRNDNRIFLINHEVNQGVGGAIATGYKKAFELGADVAVVMAGDGQMDPADLPNLLEPILAGRADYSKGNRLFTGEAYSKIPRVRDLGTAILTL